MKRIKIRDQCPSRRPNPPREKKSGKEFNCSEYKPFLAEDFNHRCGYCDGLKSILRQDFHVDHFIPQNPPKGMTTTIPNNQYENLVYACPSCNRAKSNKWPTLDENIHNDGVNGFVDPCNPQYDSHLQRDTMGRIEATTELGKYIYKNLKLYSAHHATVWMLKEIQNRIEKLKSLSASSQNNTHKQALNSLLALYYEQDQLLGELFQ